MCLDLEEPSRDSLQGGQLQDHNPLRFCFVYVNTDCVFLSLLPSEQCLSRADVASGKRRQPLFQWMQFILAHKFHMLWRFIDLPSSPPHIFPAFFNTQIQMMYKWSRFWLGRVGNIGHLYVFHCKLHNRSEFAKTYKVILVPMLCVTAQSCPTLCDPMTCSPPGSSVHWISQARLLQEGGPLLGTETGLLSNTRK